MKKHLLLFILPLLFLIPYNTNAKPVSYQDGGNFYYDYYTSSTSTTMYSGQYTFSNSEVPFYPAPGLAPPHAMYHNALEFVLINNTGSLTGRSYQATVVFTYKFDGIYRASDYENLRAYFFPQDVSLLSRSTTVTTDFVENGKYGGIKVTIRTTGNMDGTYEIDKFVVGIAFDDNTGEYLAYCDPDIYSDQYGSLSCGTSSSGLVYTQVSLLDFNLTVSQDINTGILSNIDTNQQITNDKLDQTNQKLDEIDGTLKDDDVSGAEDSASGFFNDFESDDFGLSSIVTMPLQFIQGLSSSTCYSLNLPLPFVDTNVTLPCMTSIYQKYFGDFLTLYQIITTGFIAYGVCINIFRLVQGFKNPDNDNVEVMEL